MTPDACTRVHALATAIQALSQGPTRDLARMIIEVLEKESVSVAAESAQAMAEPQEVVPEGAACECPDDRREPGGSRSSAGRPVAESASFGPPSSSRPVSMTPNAVRARARRAKESRLAELAASGQLALDLRPATMRPRSRVRDGRPTAVPLSLYSDLEVNQREQREASVRGRDRRVIDHTTDLDEELLAIAGKEMAERSFTFDIQRSWKKFRGGRVAGKALSRVELLAKWSAWCAMEEAKPRRPSARAELEIDAELPLEPERPPQDFLDAVEGVREGLPEYVRRNSFRRFAAQHPMHADIAAALAYWLNWIKGEDITKIGPRSAPPLPEFDLPFPEGGDPPADRASA